MEKPKTYNCDGRTYSTATQTYTIEYLLWSHGMLRTSEVARKMESEFRNKISMSNATVKLKALVDAGKIECLGRGLYRHPLSPML